jgi:flavin-dependent dehydrogenase
MNENWDVIIVGARCAGATLATLLAQQGVRTLVVEASSRGTNMPMSTHLVQPPGMAVLDKLGLGARVRSVAPATARFRYALDEASVTLRFDEQRAPYCVRRSTLDPWLQDKAEQAGAELCFRHRVVELVRAGDRVTGVVVNSPSGSRTLHADLVIGADGAQSTVAKLTGVEDYLVTRGSRAGYWTYYDAPSTWDADWDSTLEHQGDDVRYVFRCDGDQFLAVYVGEREAVNAWGKDRRAHLTEALAGSPTTRALTEGRQPVAPLMGLLEPRFFYRRPVGPGFALVGDAGHFEDFVTGQGMTDAFLDAERMAKAILDGREEAFAHYWRLRDVETLPIHFEAIRQGTVGFNEPFMRTVIAGMAKRPELLERLKAVFDRKLSPAEMLPTSAMLRFVAGALLRGRFNVAPGFLRTGKQLGEEARVLAGQQALLESARASLERAPQGARAGAAAANEHAA